MKSDHYFYPMINENQHKILALPQVQELFKALDCEVLDSGYSKRTGVTKRVDQWIEDLQTHTPIPRVISTDAPMSHTDGDIKTWINLKTQINGKQWCPF